MGVVFKARDPRIGRLVALKTITAGLADDADLLQRFYREAQAAGSLQHPNVVTVYEMGEEGGAPFIAMEYLEGESLEQLIARRPALRLAQRVGYLVQACRALDYAHRHGIVHRDIKPGNIMVTTEGTVKVVDFGIARLVDTSKTQTGMLLGTLGYMSPQQLRGKRADERSDIWSVGVMFYELLSYQKPFSGDNHAALILNIISEEPRPLGEAAPDCPTELQAVVHKTLRKDDAERFQSMEELLVELEPLWKRLQHSTVEQLVEQSQERMRSGELPSARDLLRQALLIDTSSSQARLLLEEVNAALKGSLLPGELQERVAKGQALLQEGLLEEAKAQAEALLELDSAYGPARQLLEQVEQGLQHAQRQNREKRAFLGEQLRTMKAAIDRGDLSDAIELGRKTIGRVGEDTDLTQLLEFAERAIKLRQQNEEIDRQLPIVYSLLEAGKFAEAERLIEEIQRNAPLEPRLPPLLEAAREKRVPSAPPALADAARPASTLVDLAREYVYERGAGAQSASRETENKPEFTAKPQRVAMLDQPARIRSSRPGVSRSPAAAGEPPDAGGERQVDIPQPGLAAQATERPWWKQPLPITSMVLALTLGVGFAVYRKIAATPRVPAKSSETAPVPSPSLEEQQRNLIALAHEAADHNDYKTAEAKLDAAEKLPGPLQSLIQDLRRKFTLEERNSEIRGVAQTERDLWSQGTTQLSQNRLDQAESSFRKILELPEGGRRKAEAERYLTEVIPRRREEERRATQAQQVRQPQQKADAAQTNQQTLQNAARQAEQLKFAELEGLYKQAEQRGDDAARQQLFYLQPQFRAIADGGGPLAPNARNYAENLIPAALKEMESRAAKAKLEAAEAARFSELVDHFKQAVEARDNNALKTRVLGEFQKLAQAGGPKAAEAAKYATVLVPAAIRDTAPWPVIGCPASPGGLSPSIKPGDLVACGLLDPPKVQWTQFSWPDFPGRARQAGQAKGIAMLSVTVDENGDVIDAKPRGKADAYGFSDTAAAAAHQWKTNPPRVQGKRVKTEFSVDVLFNQ